MKSDNIIFLLQNLRFLWIYGLWDLQRVDEPQKCNTNTIINFSFSFAPICFVGHIILAGHV